MLKTPPRQKSLQTFLFRLGALVLLAFIAWIFLSRILGWSFEASGNEDLVGLGSGKIIVEVYYEVLCPDSRYFILKQLYPTWQKVPEIMEVHFKPYGKAHHKKGSSGSFEFDCQHGPVECQGNTVHACAAHHVARPDQLMEYVRCMISDNYDPLAIGKKCAEESGLDWARINRCVSDGEGQELLAALGDDTNGLRPKVTFIPTIVLNGSQEGQKDILKDFLMELCRKYKGAQPENCIKRL